MQQFTSQEKKNPKKKNSVNCHGQKFEYMWEYYKVHALIIVAIVAGFIYTIYEIVTPDPETIFYAAVVDSPFLPDKAEELENEFSNHIQAKELENIYINDSFYFSGNNEYALNMQSVLMTHVHAKEIDVIIAPESQFKQFANAEYFDKLSEQLPTDLYSSLTDKFYICSTEDNQQESAYGIYLTDTEFFKENAHGTEPYVLGIVVNAKHKEITIDFIRFLYQLFP